MKTISAIAFPLLNLKLCCCFFYHSTFTSFVLVFLWVQCIIHLKSIAVSITALLECPDFIFGV